jgi:uncharacterized GH25 family protein
MKLTKKLAILACLAGLICLAAQSALAHSAWLSLPYYELEQGRKCKAFIGWGHQYPLDDFLKADGVTGVTIYDPKGQASPVKAINDFMFETGALKEAGAYVLASAKKPGFFTRLEKGFARRPKTGLKGVKQCSCSKNFMKAILNVGEGGTGDVARAVGQELELVPLDNPANLKIGDNMRIKVLFKGKPVTGWPMAYATHQGFIAPGFAYASWVNGKDGIFTLPILAKGAWLVNFSMSKPYPNPKECDITKYVGQLTFAIK